MAGLDPREPSELEEIVAQWRRGAFSAEIALMSLLIAGQSVAAVRAATQGAPPLAALLAANAAGCERVCAMLRTGVADCGPDASVEEGVDYARRLFDWSVQQDEAASVALYSLGSPDILARATAEIVDLLARWNLLAPQARVLDFGCGIGRLLVPLADRVQGVVGIDVSARMVEVARRRAADHPRVEVRACSGFDLADFADEAFDLVCAADSFPYVTEAGPSLARALFSEVRRVLRPGGHLALLNYSYRGDPDADRSDVKELSLAVGLEPIVCGESPFTLWDGLAFLLRR